MDEGAASLAEFAAASGCIGIIPSSPAAKSTGDSSPARAKRSGREVKRRVSGRGRCVGEGSGSDKEDDQACRGRGADGRRARRRGAELPAGLRDGVALALDRARRRGEERAPANLLALCLDADARVVSAILENPQVGLEHVRLIAFHHRTGTGLEILARRQDSTNARRATAAAQPDGRRDTVLKRVMATKRLFQTYKIAIDRDVPELTRAKSRGYMRAKYQNAPSEERADLVLRTEGRCLIYMTGCAFDAKMTQILCGGRTTRCCSSRTSRSSRRRRLPPRPPDEAAVRAARTRR